MNVYVPVAALLTLGMIPAAAQPKLTINAETPEGQLLQSIGQEQDAAKKTAMLEDFTAKFPTHEGAPWAYAQLVPIYAKAGAVDKALAAGDKALAAHPDDLDTALATLKALEKDKSPDPVLKWSATTSALARKAIQAPKPADADEAEWKQKVDYARQVDIYCDYTLYAAALASTNPEKTVQLVETLEQRNPESQYLAESYPPYFRALLQSKNTDKAVQLAEKLLAKGQADEDMLITIADYNFNKQQNPDKVIAASTKAVEILDAKPAPAGVDPAAWTKTKNSKLGIAHWYTGMTYANQTKFLQADTELRAALPLLEGNDVLRGGALFTLGLANFKIGQAAKGDTGSKRILDAYRYSQQSAAIKSPWQALAQKNVAAIRTQYHMK